MALAFERQATDTQGDEEATAQEPDDPAPFGRSSDEKRDADSDEDHREDHDRPAIDSHDASEAVTSTRQGAFLRT
jgi:hypothetical protein